MDFFAVQVLSPNESGKSQVTFFNSSFIIESFYQVLPFSHQNSIDNHLMVKQD
jgi:hypothetical protein